MIAARPAVTGRPARRPRVVALSEDGYSLEVERSFFRAGAIAHFEFRIVVTNSLRLCGFNSQPSRDLQSGRSGRSSNAPQQSADAVEAM